jgi:NitT/TauT family transport system ATP-binding protein
MPVSGMPQMNSDLELKVLQVHQLSHSFGITEVLSDIDLVLRAGRIMALVGPSGCGKTTLLHLCAGLTELREGDIRNGFDTTAFMFQQPRLLPWKNTLENIAIGLKARRVARTDRELLAGDLGLRMGLAHDDLDKFPHELSGGMQQRTALARALALQPDLLLLDEPFSALDIGLKNELYRLLIEQLLHRDAAVLMITHDLMEAARLSDVILLMQRDPGRIVEEFTLQQPLSERDDRWVYDTTVELMQSPSVRASFGLDNAQ